MKSGKREFWRFWLWTIFLASMLAGLLNLAVGAGFLTPVAYNKDAIGHAITFWGIGLAALLLASAGKLVKATLPGGISLEFAALADRVNQKTAENSRLAVEVRDLQQKLGTRLTGKQAIKAVVDTKRPEPPEGLIQPITDHGDPREAVSEASRNARATGSVSGSTARSMQKSSILT